jgi:tRNA nucleotidyltransferase (CCA-adding enzyme)
MVGRSSWKEIRGRALNSIVPRRAEEEAVKSFARRVVEELSGRLSEAGVRGVAEVHGSVARGTWLAKERDFDVFIILEEGYGREDLPDVLDVVKGYLGKNWIEAYAEHPYLIADVDGFRVEFVPCFRVDPREGLISATDRTPLHTGFVVDRLSVEGKDEVRLLKRFMRGIGVYGAEVKVKGFSGYLCELLVITLGSFEGVLEEASGWKGGDVVDPMGGTDHDDLRKQFGTPLIVPDPVDPGRNVASAVSETRFWEFSAAASVFLERPRWEFFYPEEGEVDVDELLERVRDHGFDLVFLIVGDGEAEVPDVLWGQLNKSERALVAALGDAGFSVVRSGVWSDEASSHVFVFELESATLPDFVRRMGPPVRMVEGVRQFLDAHTDSEETVVGPWVEGDRWWVVTERGSRKARAALGTFLVNGGRGVGVSKGIAERVSKSFRVLRGGEVEEELTPDFATYLDGFLRGRPGWLE